MQTETLFTERKTRADREAFRPILNRAGGEPPRPDALWDPSDLAPSGLSPESR
jgi:hypothetical protein